MATTTVRTSERIAASARALFPLISDYRLAPSVIEGLETLQPLTRRTEGVGSRFRAEMRLGPTVVRAELEIVELVVDERITWASSAEDRRALTFVLTELTEVTRVELLISYAPPDGLSGLLLAPVVEETVRSKARDTLARLAQLGLDE